MVESFHDHVFQFIAQILFDGAFVRFRHFGVVGEHADGAEIVAGAAFVGGKEFLHGIGGVGAVVQDLSQRGMASADSGQRIAQCLRMFGALFAFVAKSGHLGVKFGDLLLHRAHLAVRGIECVGGLFRIAAKADGTFQQIVFVRFAAAQRFALMNQRFFGLLLFAVQTQQAFAGFGSGLAQ